MLGDQSNWDQSQGSTVMGICNPSGKTRGEDNVKATKEEDFITSEDFSAYGAVRLMVEHGIRRILPNGVSEGKEVLLKVVITLFHQTWL